jgi:hypothetical protein
MPRNEGRQTAPARLEWVSRNLTNALAKRGVRVPTRYVNAVSELAVCLAATGE